MTMTAERPRYAGARRFDAQPMSVTRPRHRAGELLIIALFAQLVELVKPPLTALVRWTAGTTARAAVVVAVSAFLLALMLLGSALVLIEPVRSGPAPTFVTPTPTAFPSGWTYTL